MFILIELRQIFTNFSYQNYHMLLLTLAVDLPQLGPSNPSKHWHMDGSPAAPVATGNRSAQRPCPEQLASAHASRPCTIPRTAGPKLCSTYVCSAWQRAFVLPSELAPQITRPEAPARFVFARISALFPPAVTIRLLLSDLSCSDSATRD